MRLRKTVRRTLSLVPGYSTIKLPRPGLYSTCLILRGPPCSVDSGSSTLRTCAMALLSAGTCAGGLFCKFFASPACAAQHTDDSATARERACQKPHIPTYTMHMHAKQKTRTRAREHAHALQSTHRAETNSPIRSANTPTNRFSLNCKFFATNVNVVERGRGSGVSRHCNSTKTTLNFLNGVA